MLCEHGEDIAAGPLGSPLLGSGLGSGGGGGITTLFGLLLLALLLLLFFIVITLQEQKQRIQSLKRHFSSLTTQRWGKSTLYVIGEE